MKYPSHKVSNDWHWIEVRMMKSTEHHPKPVVVDEYKSNEEDEGFINTMFLEITHKLTNEIH